MKLLLILTLFLLPLIAAPAFQGKRTFTQPDGTVITYQNRGDEHLHWSESEDGEIILYNKETKRMEFAEIKAERLQPSGESYTKARSVSRKYAPTQVTKRLNKEQLEWLYNIKREAHIKSMRPNR